MIQMTIQVPDKLAEQSWFAGPWLPAIIELSLIGCKTQAAATSAELVEFLSGNPSPEKLLGFHVSESAQLRLRRLLALNEAGCLSEAEQQELDELQCLEHFVVMLKAEIAGQFRKEH